MKMALDKFFFFVKHMTMSYFVGLKKIILLYFKYNGQIHTSHLGLHMDQS